MAKAKKASVSKKTQLTTARKKATAKVSSPKKKAVKKTVKKRTTVRKKTTSLRKKKVFPLQEGQITAQDIQRVDGRIFEQPIIELPDKYNENKIVLQIRDPWWVHSYWEMKDSIGDEMQQRFGDRFNGAKTTLRLYDVTNIMFDGTNANTFFDIDVHCGATNWYVHLNKSGCSWCLDLGFTLNDGTFVMVVRSNTVQTPLGRPSDITDEEWMIPDDLFQRLFGLKAMNRSFSSFGKWEVGHLGVSSLDVSSWGLSGKGKSKG